MKNLPVFSKSFVEFLREVEQESRVARLIMSVSKMYDDGFSNLVYCVLRTDEVNYITYRDNGNISFLPAGKEHCVNDDGTWKRDGRQEGKPARVMRKLFTKNALSLLKDNDFEIFNNKYKAKYSMNGFVFEIMPNKRIPHVYDMELYEGDSSLSGSCMNGDSDYLEIYANCKHLRILTLIKDEKLAGRALLWNLQYEGQDIVLMDRIYVAQDHLYDAFINYAKQNDMWHKLDYKSYSNKRDFINENGACISYTFTVHTDTDFEEYPYIDTFTYGGDGYLTNSTGHEYEYKNTDGTRDGDNIRIDEITDERISDDDAVYIDRGRYRDRTTHVDNAVRDVNDNWWWSEDDDIVQIGGDWYPKDSDSIVYVDSNDEYYLMDDCCYSDKDEQWYLSDDCVYSDYRETYILKSEAYKCGDSYYHEDDVEKLD